MKVTGLSTWLVANPPPHFGGRYFLLVQVHTDVGITGLGEIYAATFAPERMLDLARDLFQRELLDRDPGLIEAFWRRAYGSGFSQRPDLTLMAVLSGLEMACWDIIGKDLDRPVHALLGGRVQDSIRTYSYLYPEPGDTSDVYADPDLAAERALACVAQGFDALKFDPTGGYSAFDPRQPTQEQMQRTRLFCQRLREAVGDRADLLLGTHGQFTPAGAIRLARTLEAYDPLWFEEPVPPDMPEEMARVARGTSIPIATGERLVTKYEFQRVLALGAAHILQLSVARCGGLLEAKKIAALAEVYQAQIAPHLYSGPVAAAANLQLAACCPNVLMLEGIQRWDGFHGALVGQPFVWADGRVQVPLTPGLGVELDEDLARAHPWQGDQLHLQMAEQPLG